MRNIRKEAKSFIEENKVPFSAPVNGIRDIDLILEHYKDCSHTFTYETKEGIELKILNVERRESGDFAYF